ncbi:MAG: nucleoside triphosphate pyrophosphohydrolase [Caldimicrobium sp.]|nr:nucleoside triphosphate pyrophosphohydrolase [Caldimicrobium sp.]MCX7612851.1 nucleoside triphosphate pyrophosphohydrolase [Caldimicrobium sp.]MDW8183621.1 nucleoside triphosphate pyrophosphohydrolase [Caldimicrobium sp.]
MGETLKFYFNTKGDLSSLIDIIEVLRGERGCPWDKKQTPQTLKKYLLEECYEVLEALDREDQEEIKEELGDLLFILLFIIFLYEEKGAFKLKDLLFLTFNKMISRHPHVFGEASASDAEEVVRQWQRIKEKEGKGESVLGNIPRGMPSLQKAYRVGERAARVGFDWQKAEDVLDKIYEELREIKEVLHSSSTEKLSEEIGDLLFSVANFARKLKINPEEALKEAVNKFESRFKKMESMVKRQGKSLEEMTLEEMDEIWNNLKNEENA